MTQDDSISIFSYDRDQFQPPWVVNSHFGAVCRLAEDGYHKVRMQHCSLCRMMEPLLGSSAMLSGVPAFPKDKLESEVAMMRSSNSSQPRRSRRTHIFPSRKFAPGNQTHPTRLVRSTRSCKKVSLMTEVVYLTRWICSTSRSAFRC